VTQDDLFDAFLDGLQFSRAELHPSLDVVEAMSNAGEVLRELINGIERLLQNRADLEAIFRLDQTTTMPGRNNPLQLSQNTEDLVKQLLVGRGAESLAPREAAHEVCRDLLAHQEAFVDAMTEACAGFAERFDPEELGANFELSLDRKPWFPFLQARKYWDLYKDLYPVLTEKGGGRFPQMFAEEFASAYERRVIESQREHRPGGTLPGVKMEPLIEEAFVAEHAATAEASGSPSDQVGQSSEAPLEVLENIGDLNDLEELVDLDDLEALSDAFDLEDADDTGQAKA
jgi:hypothetical protein